MTASGRITGVHALLYSKDPDSTRAFLRDVLELPAVDAGHGWLIFALPPAEVGVHPVGEGSDAPSEMAGRHQLYLMCDDIRKAVARLKAKGVEFATPISDEGWGLLTAIRLPAGETIGLYQPRHPVALGLAPNALPRPARRPSKPSARRTPTKSRARKPARPRRKGSR